MTEDQAKIAALKFAIEMTQATRLATIEECAEIAETFYDGFDPTLTAGRAAAAKAISRSIRSLSQPKPGKE